MKSETKSESARAREFDYASFWRLTEERQGNMQHLVQEHAFDDDPMEHPLPGPQPEPGIHQDRFVLDMDDDEYEAYREFIASHIEANDFAPLRGINEKEYVLKLTVKRDSKGGREIEVKEVGFRNKVKHASWYPRPDMEEVNGVLSDVSAFNTHDFRRHAPAFDMLRYKLEKRQQHLKDLLLEFTTIQNMSRATYENLKARILSAHDDIKGLKARRRGRS